MQINNVVLIASHFSFIAVHVVYLLLPAPTASWSLSQLTG
jgi:hypothetical protein